MKHAGKGIGIPRFPMIYISLPAGSLPELGMYKKAPFATPRLNYRKLF